METPFVDINVIIVTVGTIVTQLLVMLAGYFKFKSELGARTKEIKYHSDVSVQKLNGMLTSVIMSFDRPAWVKVAESDGDKVIFRMLEMNEHYGDMHGVSRQDYIGKTDLEAGVPKAVADLFHAHDVQVWASGEPQTFVEDINGTPRRFRKIRVMNKDGKLKGVMGYGIDCNEPTNCPLHTQENFEKLLDKIN